MTKNIEANLLRFNGEIGPQYLDPNDTTGGPDGTMKPITREILQEMIILNFPEVKMVGNFVEYRILSTDPMPEAKVEEKGAQLLIMDTGEVFFNHGGSWGEF